MDAKGAAAHAAHAAQLEDELVEQTWNALKKPEGAAAAAAAAAEGPEPAPAPEREQTIDELAAELKKHPFFATSLDDLGDDNPELEALKALAYEGTRAEIAENFRQQGNEAAQAKDWSTAKEYYSKSLAALKADRREDEIADLNNEGPGWEATEEAKERDLKDKCLSNRALCHLSLKNYRSCSLDCLAALEVNSSNTKAYYRLAQALLALGKLEEASKSANAGLETDPENAALIQTSKTINTAIQTRDQREQKRKAEVDRQTQEKRVLTAALAARQIVTRTTDNPPDLENAALSLTPDPLSPTSSLTVPVLVLYPLDAQTDFVKAFGEQQTLADHLEYLLPLPWDTQGEYGGPTTDKTEAYLETAEGGLVKWGTKAALLKLIAGGKVAIVDGIVTVNIVPKARSDEWIREFKRRKGRS